jgi:hypothetical protein
LDRRGEIPAGAQTNSGRGPTRALEASGGRPEGQVRRAEAPRDTLGGGEDHPERAAYRPKDPIPGFEAAVPEPKVASPEPKVACPDPTDGPTGLEAGSCLQAVGENSFSRRPRTGSLLGRDRPADLVACLHRKRLAHGRLARTAHWCRLEADPRRSRGDSDRQGEAGGLPRGYPAQWGGSAVIPGDGDVHVERRSIFDLGPGLIRWRHVRRRSAVAADREEQEQSRESSQCTHRSPVKAKMLNLTLGRPHSPVPAVETRR